MIWDFLSDYYDVFENICNGRVNRLLCKRVARRMSPGDEVLECACGTGMISVHIAAACKSLTATDFSDGMLRRVRRRCGAMKTPFLQIISRFLCEENDFSWEGTFRGTLRTAKKFDKNCPPPRLQSVFQELSKVEMDDPVFIGL